MEHLNYCRQMVKQFSATLKIPSIDAMARERLSHAVDLALASQKFILPENGRLYDDPEYKALDEFEPLTLPFNFIALEYSRGGAPASAEGGRSSKAIVFASQRDDVIVVTPIMWIDARGIWGPMPEVALPRTGFLDRSQKSDDGYVSIKAFFESRQFPLSDYADELGTLLCFLNILRCRNVNIERSDPARLKNQMAARKGALPFDTYHILTIDVPSSGDGTRHGIASGRSPREHLRRGHIRRLADGRRIWVNATVVAAGRGAGVVSKDYRLRGTAAAQQ